MQKKITTIIDRLINLRVLINIPKSYLMISEPTHLKIWLSLNEYT